MGFYVVNGDPQGFDERWFPIDDVDTIYNGQLVASAYVSDGVKPLGAAAGFANFTNTGTNKMVPLGVVTANNRTNDLFDSTYNTLSIVGGTNTGAITAAEQSAIEKSLVDGHLGAVGDIEAKVKVQLISPASIIRGPIYATAFGTAIAVSTITVASADGGLAAATAGAPDAGSFLAGNSTIYFRSGGNEGVYRVGINTTNTAPQVDKATPNTAWAVGDTYVQVPFKLGLTKIQFEATESMYVNNAGTYGTHFYWVNVVGMNLTTSGKETVDFQFVPNNWLTDIAAA